MQKKVGPAPMPSRSETRFSWHWPDSWRMLGGCSLFSRHLEASLRRGWRIRKDTEGKKNKKGENGEMEMMQRGNWSKRGPRRKASVKADVAHRSFNRLLFFFFFFFLVLLLFFTLFSSSHLLFLSLSLCILVPISCILPSLRCDPILIHQCILIPFRWIPLPIGSQLGFFLLAYSIWMVINLIELLRLRWCRLISLGGFDSVWLFVCCWNSSTNIQLIAHGAAHLFLLIFPLLSVTFRQLGVGPWNK